MTQVYTADSFRVASVVVDGIASACSSDTLRVSLLGDGGSVLNTFNIDNPTTTSVSTDRSSSNIDAGSVKKITVTTEGN
jgi:hypothetical protein